MKLPPPLPFSDDIGSDRTECHRIPLPYLRGYGTGFRKTNQADELLNLNIYLQAPFLSVLL